MARLVEVDNVKSDYRLEEKLGFCGYRAVHKVTGATVFLRKNYQMDDEVTSTEMREFMVLNSLRHKNIVGLTSFACNGLYTVFEWVPLCLSAYMRKLDKAMEIPLVKSFMYQLLRGVAFCHSHAVMHRDLKPSHVRVDQHGTIKISGFALCRTFIVPIRPYTHEVVTLWYRAPEILLGAKQYGPEIDVWSIGTIFAEMVNKKGCGRPLWPGDSEIDQLFQIFYMLGTPDETTWPGVSELRDYQATFPRWPAGKLAAAVTGLDKAGLDLLQRLLTYDPSKRISCKAALAHPWFDDLDKSAL